MARKPEAISSTKTYLMKNYMISGKLRSIESAYLIPLMVLCIFLTPNNGFPEVYSTWDTMEADKCASAWLIKRFVDKEAEFEFYPKGVLISSGIPFDTPEAELRRYHNMSAFESILKRYELDDPVLIEMGKIFHDLEVNFWGRKLRKESETIENGIRKIEAEYRNPKQILEKSFGYFDILYRDFKEALP